MKTLTKSSLILIMLITSIILISAVSAADNSTDLTPMNTESDVDSLEIENDDNSNNNEVISTDDHENGEGYIKFEKDNYEIGENNQNTFVKGNIFYSEEGYDDYTPYNLAKINLTCNYTDGNNIARSYNLQADEGEFQFNLNQCEGLLASKSPYILTFSPVNDTFYDIYLEESGNRPLANSWITLTVNDGQGPSEQIIYVRSNDGVDADGYGTKDQPYKTIKYAVSKADTNYVIYIYSGRYDENSITLTKSLSIVGENKNVIITSTTNNRNVFETLYDENGVHISLRFENLTFDTIKAGQYNAILKLRNDDRNEIINCVFENNDGERNIWSSSSETVIENCEFKDCQYTSSGNIIYLSGKGTQSIINTTFDRISNSGSGVLTIINIMNRPTTANINNISIRQSSGIITAISDSGSGNLPNSINIQNSIFENNEFYKSNTNIGGALFDVASYSKLEIANSTMIENTLSRGIFIGGNNETQIRANNNLIYNNTGSILLSALASKPVKYYDLDYNYWGSEDPDLGDLNIHVIATNKDFTETKTIKNKIAPTMNTTVANSTINKGDNITINVTLNEDAEGYITITGLNVEPQQLVNGKTTFIISNLLPNHYTIILSYSGDYFYDKISNEINFIVKDLTPIVPPENNTNNASKDKENKKVTPTPAKKSKVSSKIIAKKKTFKAKKVKKYTITLKAGKKPIKNVRVTIKVGKKTYKATTNAKGKATFKLKKLTKKGKYTAVIKFKGNKTYKAATKKVKIIVKK